MFIFCQFPERLIPQISAAFVQKNNVLWNNSGKVIAFAEILRYDKLKFER